jgi:hypothetical protein
MKHTQQLWYKMNKIVWFELLLLNLVYCRMILLIRLFTIPLIVTFHSKSSNKCYSHVVNWLKIIALALFCFVFVCPMLSLSLDCLFLFVTSVFSNVYLQCLWIVRSWLSLRFSLTFIYIVSGLSVLDCHFGLSLRFSLMFIYP